MNGQIVANQNQTAEIKETQVPDFFSSKKKKKTGYFATYNTDNQYKNNFPDRASSQQIHHEIRNIKLNNSSIPIQFKLKINNPNDKFEQEANHIAEKITQIPDSREQKNLYARQIVSPVQRKTNINNTIKGKFVQTKNIGCPAQKQGVANDSFSETIPKGGSPLADSVRQYFEPRFGTSLEHIRIHTDSVAAKKATAIQAKAYTLKNHIVFGSNYYKPHTVEGKKLIAHELIHTFQQKGIYDNNHTTLQREPEQERGTTTSTTSSSTTPAAPATPQQCNATSIRALITATNADLTTAISRLSNYSTSCSGSGTCPANLRVIGRILNANFHTTNAQYIQLIIDRLNLIKSKLSSARIVGSGQARPSGQGQQPPAANTLTIACQPANSSSCQSSNPLNSSVMGFCDRPYHINFCSAITIDTSSKDLLIHETVHAVVPQLGSRQTVNNSDESPIDRAYDYNRIYSLLTTEEALHNAESYNRLVRQIVVGRITAPSSQRVTNVSGFANSQQSGQMRMAIALAERWNQSADAWINAARRHLNAGNTLAPADANRILPFKPSMLNNLSIFYAQLNGYFQHLMDARLVRSTANCQGGVVGYVPANSQMAWLTRTGSSLSGSPGQNYHFRVCPAWLQLTGVEQAEVFYGLMILKYINQAPDVTRPFSTNIYDYIRLAKTLNDYIIPAPAGQNAAQHQRADQQAQQPPSQPSTQPSAQPQPQP